MESIQERARNYLLNTVQHFSLADIDALVSVLKTEQKITRHACVDNILDLERYQPEKLIKEYVALDNVESVIMNTNPR